MVSFLFFQESVLQNTYGTVRMYIVRKLVFLNLAAGQLWRRVIKIHYKTIEVVVRMTNQLK